MSDDPKPPRPEIEALLRQIRELEQISHEPEAQQHLRQIKGLLEDLQAREAEAASAETSGAGAASGAAPEVPPGPPTAWQRVLLARHSQRPYFLDYVEHLFQGFSEIHGDRAFSDDPAIICGMARFRGQPVLAVGQQKGRTTKEKLHRNFGMSKPEGYRKAIRAMRFAAKFGRPILTFLDTPGAYPGIDAEARGQAEAIAYNLREMARLPVPIIVTVIGEGGSGGALGIGVGDVVLILENAIYSVISPESCAAIVWRDSAKAELAANALKLTAPDLLRLGIVDEVVPEPPGGAHADHQAAAALLATAIERCLADAQKLPPDELLERRYQKFRKMAPFWVGE
jgi:acetyl-CoA carboxylase carboxyl transferase subunit alpha